MDFPNKNRSSLSTFSLTPRVVATWDQGFPPLQARGAPSFGFQGVKFWFPIFPNMPPMGVKKQPFPTHLANTYKHEGLDSDSRKRWSWDPHHGRRCTLARGSSAHRKERTQSSSGGRPPPPPESSLFAAACSRRIAPNWRINLLLIPFWSQPIRAKKGLLRGSSKIR